MRNLDLSLPTVVLPHNQRNPPRHRQDLDWETDNLFLNGPFVPWNEESEAFDLPVIGALPSDLNGALFRIANNPRFTPVDLERYHWWEGDGAVAATYIRDGKASFRMRWVMTDTMKIEVEAGQAIYPGFVNGNDRGPLPEGIPPVKNIANTNVGIFGDHLLVYFDGGLPTEMHPETLDTQAPFDFNGTIDLVCTAHHKVDPKTGDGLFFAVVGEKLQWFQVDARTGEVKDTVTFSLGCPAQVHDYIISENHAIFMVSPTQFRIDRMMQGRPGVLWDPEAVPEGSRFAVLDRRTHEVTWYDTGVMLAPTHFFNAYETPTGFVVDLCVVTRLGNPASTPDDPVSSHSWFPPSMLWRFTLDRVTKKAGNEMLSGVCGEFPMINDDWIGQQLRYGYFVATRGLSAHTYSDGLGRHDFTSGQTVVLEGIDGLTSPSEPVFVARPGATEEDDGYLLSLWWNPATGLSELLVHDAVEFAREPLARVQLPVRVPYSFHGSWADAAELDSAISAQSAIA
ncbi:carotenoid oxygenase family protein [Nocardioides hungaricus]